MGDAVGTVTTLTEESFGSVKSIYWAWRGGTTETAIASATSENYYNGKVLFFISDPGANCKAGFDVTVLDKNDNDVLARSGLDLGATTVVTICEGSLGAVVNSQLELVVADAGSAGTEVGEVWLYIR